MNTDSSSTVGIVIPHRDIIARGCQGEDPIVVFETLVGSLKGVLFKLFESASREPLTKLLELLCRIQWGSSAPYLLCIRSQ